LEPIYDNCLLWARHAKMTWPKRRRASGIEDFELDVSPDALNRLKEGLKCYICKEGREKKVWVEYRKDPDSGSHHFIAWSANYVDANLEFDEELGERPEFKERRPVEEIGFRFSEDEATLECCIEGNKLRAEAIRNLFGRHILGL